MRIVFAVILFVHGFAHLPGFLVPWHLATLKDLPYKTTILADSVEVGYAGIRVVGVLWLIAAVALAACGVAVVGRLPWWQSATWTAIALSFIMCIGGWPEARIGVFVNVGIAIVLLVSTQMRWFS